MPLPSRFVCAYNDGWILSVEDEHEIQEEDPGNAHAFAVHDNLLGGMQPSDL
jgi:hypothetical protein